jgi:hypothetical protein
MEDSHSSPSVYNMLQMLTFIMIYFFDSQLFKMVDTITDSYESTLKTLANIAEAGGYIKKEVREDMQKAVSIIRNCFKELTSTVGGRIRKKDKI